jgi:hypothetical protein
MCHNFLPGKQTLWKLGTWKICYNFLPVNPTLWESGTWKMCHNFLPGKPTPLRIRNFEFSIANWVLGFSTSLIFKTCAIFEAYVFSLLRIFCDLNHRSFFSTEMISFLFWDCSLLKNNTMIDCMDIVFLLSNFSFKFFQHSFIFCFCIFQCILYRLKIRRSGSFAN